MGRTLRNKLPTKITVNLPAPIAAYLYYRLQRDGVTLTRVVTAAITNEMRNDKNYDNKTKN